MFRCPTKRKFLVQWSGSKILNSPRINLPHLQSTALFLSGKQSPNFNQRSHIILKRSASTSSSSFPPDEDARPSESQESGEEGGEGRKTSYQYEATSVLRASLRHVPRLGWSESSMIAGAKEADVSPSIVGSFPRKEAALVEFFMDECLQKLVDIIESEEEIKHMVPSDAISKLVRIRLEMQAPYISNWPQALSIQAQPLNFRASVKQRAMLVDEIWHGVGDDASDIDWYLKRTVLGGIYTATEVYMLSDTSPDYVDTWEFLDVRMKDGFDLRKTIQEAKYVTEAVGAGIKRSVYSFLKNAPQG